MGFFAYRATDSQGQTTEGTIQAATAADAHRLLTGGGLRVLGVSEMGAATASRPPVPAHRPVSSPVNRPVAVSTPQPVAAPKRVLAAPYVAPFPGVKPRSMGNYRARFFFEQLGRYLMTGVAPHQALHELAQRARKSWIAERMEMAAQAVAKGTALSDALEACRMCPPGAYGTLKAGEASGALPDACMRVGDQAEKSFRLAFRCHWMSFYFILTALIAPYLFAMVEGTNDTIADQWEHDGQLPAVGTAAHHWGAHFAQTLPYALLLDVAIVLAFWLWLSRPLQMFRHRLSLNVPILGPRAKDESLSRFSWALTELSRAGIPPNQAFRLAAEACPNLAMAERLRNEAAAMREQEKLSVALRRSNLLEPQLVDVVENGELTGDVPGAVSSVQRITGDSFERRDNSAHTKIWMILYPIIGITIAIILRQLYVNLLLGYFKNIQ